MPLTTEQAANLLTSQIKAKYKNPKNELRVPVYLRGERRFMRFLNAKEVTPENITAMLTFLDKNPQTQFTDLSSAKPSIGQRITSFIPGFEQVKQTLTGTPVGKIKAQTTPGSKLPQAPQSQEIWDITAPRTESVAQGTQPGKLE